MPAAATDRMGTSPAMSVIEVEGRVVAVRTVALACCAVEVNDAQAFWQELPDGGAEPECYVLVVAGTVAEGLVDRLLHMWRELPAPRAVVAYGACTISGGPYWDSYQVRQGLPDELTPVVDVPGCPPRPDTLVAAVVQAAGLAVRGSQPEAQGSGS